MKNFIKYILVGLLNTACHWSVFLILVYIFYLSQGPSNLIAFLIAATISFFINGKWTFDSKLSTLKYIMFLVFMGCISYICEFGASLLNLPPIVTLISFSLTSLILGFLISKFFIFKEVA